MSLNGLAPDYAIYKCFRWSHDLRRLYKNKTELDPKVSVEGLFSITLLCFIAFLILALSQVINVASFKKLAFQYVM